MTIAYLLDTNIVSALLHDADGPARRILERRTPQRVGMSVIVAGEVWAGVEKRQSQRLRDQVERVLAQFTILPLGLDVSPLYGQIRADLEGRGMVIGQNDLWIAAHALALNLTLVTDNVGEFERVEGLRVENWLHP